MFCGKEDMKCGGGRMRGWLVDGGKLWLQVVMEISSFGGGARG